MKKTLGLVLILILAFGLIGCSTGLEDESEAGYGKLNVSLGDAQKDLAGDVDKIVVRGDMNSWGGWNPDGEPAPDLELTDEDEDGVYTLDFNDLDTSNDYVSDPQENDEYKIVATDEDGNLISELTDGRKVESSQTQFSYKRLEDLSEEVSISFSNSDQNIDLGKENNVTNGEYNIVALSGPYATKLENIKVNTNETTNITIDKNFVKASGPVTFKFNPSDYDDISLTNSTEISLVGEMTAWEPGKDSTLMKKNDDGSYSITIDEVVAGQGYKLVINNDPENMEWGWEAPDTDDRILVTPEGLDAGGAGNYSVSVEEVNDIGEIDSYDY